MFVEKTHTLTVIEILEGTKKDIQKNIELLASDYLEKTGRRVCRSCPSDINYMILTLKNIYRMTQFKFKHHNAQYKNAKGDRTTISNGNMTDEKAIEFLRTNPERISLFAVYPSNWETILIDGVDKETVKQKEARLAVEAELEAAAEAAADKEAAAAVQFETAAGTSENLNVVFKKESEEGLDHTEETEEEKAARQEEEAIEKEAANEAAKGEATEAAAAGEAAANEAIKETAAESKSVPSIEELQQMSLKELRVLYPEIKATSIKDFIDKINA